MEEKMAEKEKNPTPQELAQCFIRNVSYSDDKRSYDWCGQYSFDECIKGMDLTYYDEDSGWTPLTIALARSSYYFGQHSPCDRSLKGVYGSGRVTVDDLLKQPSKDHDCALLYAARYPETFQKMMALTFLTEPSVDCFFQYDSWDKRYVPQRGYSVDPMWDILDECEDSPKYDEKRIFSKEFWERVGRLDSDKKLVYRSCPGFKAEWLLDDYRGLKDGERNFSDSTLRDALKKFGAVLSQDSKLQDEVDELKKGVKGLNLEYSCYSHYASGHFGGDRFHDYDGGHLTADYLEKLNQNYPNIERVTLPEFEPYKHKDFHYTLEHEIGDAQFEAVAKFKKVKHLGVGYQPRMTSKAFSTIASMKNLESLAFNNMEIKKADLEKLLKLPKLQELNLKECKYDEELIRKKTNLLCVDGKWVAPKHPDYKKAKKIEEARLAEVARIKSLTGKDWKDKFHQAMAEGRKYDAIEILKLNHVFDKRTEIHNSSWKRQTHEEVGPHILTLFGQNEMKVRNDCLSQDIVELGGDYIAIATLYEDRDWHSSAGYSGGVGWYWNGEVAVIHLDKGVGEIANTGSLCVRHPTDSYRDIFDNIDKKDILRVEDGKAIVRLGDYSSASVTLPEVSKAEDRQLRDRQAEKLKELRRGITLKDTLKKRQTSQSKAIKEAEKFHAVRFSQKTALKFKRGRVK